MIPGGPESLISTFGLPGIALGVALEGEGAAFFGGVVAHRGLVPVTGAVLAATVGAVLSDNVTFATGRFAGRSAGVRRLLDSGTGVRLRDALERRPNAFILSFRFLYGMKAAGAAALGTTNVSWLRSAALDLASSFVWANLWIWLGIAGGAAIERMIGRLELHEHLLVAVTASVVLVAALCLARRYARSRPALGAR